MMIQLFVSSFVLHVFLFGIIRLGVFGLNLSLILNNLLNNKINLIPIFSFIVFILLNVYLSDNLIYLEDVTVFVNLDDTKFELSGNALNIIFDKLGAAAVFGTSARVAAALLAKNSMGIIPKIGIVGSTAGGYTILYKLCTSGLSSNIDTGSASVTVSPVISLNTDVDKALKEKNIETFFNYFGVDKSELTNFKVKVIHQLKNKNINIESSDGDFNSEIISKLDNIRPDWKDQFVPSPLEDNLTNHIIDVLSNNLLLHFIILYLLIMLLIIISCKFIIKDNIEFTKIQNNPLGAWVKYLINKIISIWKVSSNFWIYFILFNVLVFNFATIYTISNLLILLK